MSGGYSGDISIEGNATNDSLSFQGTGSITFVGSRDQIFGGTTWSEWPKFIVEKTASSRLDPDSNTNGGIFVKGFHFHRGQIMLPSSLSINPKIDSPSLLIFEVNKRNNSDPDPVILNTDTQAYALHLQPVNSECDKLAGATPEVLFSSQLPMFPAALSMHADNGTSTLCSGKDVHFKAGPTFSTITTASFIFSSGIFDFPSVEVTNFLTFANLSSENFVNGGNGYIELTETGSSSPTIVQVLVEQGGENFQLPSILGTSSTGIVISAVEMKIESLFVTDEVPFIHFQSPIVGRKVNVKIQPTHATLPEFIPYFNMTYPYLFKLPSASIVTGLDILTVQPRMRDANCQLFPRGQISLSNLSIGSFQSLPTVMECTTSSQSAFELRVAAYNTTIADNIPDTAVTMTSSTTVHTGPSLIVNGASVGLGSFYGGMITNASIPQ